MKIGSPPKKNWGWAQKVFLGAKIQTPPFSDGRCAETRRNSAKNKTTGITAISRLHSHPRLVKFGSGAFEL